MPNNKTTYVIFGASGDLAKRYLFPALKNMNFEGAVVPVSRKDYGNLKNLVKGEGEKIFHLAIPPEAVSDAVKLISDNFGNVGIKILLEKPFGGGLKSAQDLIKHIAKYFKEDQIFRVDHYLAKQSLHAVITETWSKDDVFSIEIVASEKIDIEGRINFYEQTGALKDFVQSHLLEMTAVVLSGSFETARRYEALQKASVVCDITKEKCVKRGQYEGYRQEVGNRESMTETFVYINTASNDPRWRGVQILLTTGKGLAEKLTQIKITYKNGTVRVFDIKHEPNAYQRVISAAIEGNHDLFIGSGEVLESWRILDAIMQTWKNSKDDLIIYPKGSYINDIK